jgi:hypothetical protein
MLMDIKLKLELLESFIAEENFKAKNVGVVTVTAVQLMVKTV